jgi:hypothetical protein
LPRRQKLRLKELERVDDALIAKTGAFLRGESAVGTHTIRAVWIHVGRWGRRVVLETNRGLITLNATSVRSLVDAWGRQTADWKGKHVKARIVTMNVGGSERRVLLVEPATENQD